MMEVIGDWAAKGQQPMGAPTEVRAVPSGKLYITDDRNGAVLRLSSER
jgi:glucose/arabinose dehydrogenase